MRQALVSLGEWIRRSLSRFRSWVSAPPANIGPAASGNVADYAAIERVVLTDGVSRTLFSQYAEHRAGSRGNEETGWILMGLRREAEAIALAALPAGAGREAGVAHVRFNALAQAVASRFVRQTDRRLTTLGVVHTHPGSLRHPSDGDYEGDREWVRLLRGQEGIFGIGTVFASVEEDWIGQQPKPHAQCYGGLRFDWYALAESAADYQPVPVSLAIGPDLARPLHPVWTTLELHAARLENICRQLQRVRFEPQDDEAGPSLLIAVPLGPDEGVRVVLRGESVQYYLVRKEQWLVAETEEPRVDVGVFAMLADLAK